MRPIRFTAVAAGFLTCAGAASAGLIPTPPLDIELQLDSQTVWTDDPVGDPAGDGAFNYAGGSSADDWTIQYEAITFGGASAFGRRGERLSWVNLSAEIMNNDDVTHRFTFTATMPIAPVIMPAVMGGSAQGGMTGGSSPATLAAVADGSIYAGMIDLSVVPGSELFADPASISVAAFGSDSLGSDSFGNPIPSDAAPDVLATLGVRFDFLLDPGATATVSGIFVVNIPTPASLALLGIAGMLFIRRHRA